MEDNFSARIVYLPEAYDMAFKVSQLITDSPHSFDVIVGISRGGLPPARIICDFLNIKTLTAVQIRHYESGGKEKEEVTVTDPVDIDLNGKNVLIVDDVNDSGKTLKAAYEHVSALGPDMVKIAVLHEKQNTSHNADYTGSVLSDWKWLIYQWAVTEDIIEFLKKDDMLKVNEEEAIQHLEKKYDLNITEDLFKKVMAMKDHYFSN